MEWNCGENREEISKLEGVVSLTWWQGHPSKVLDSWTTYVMSLFPIPIKLVKKLDKLGRDFLWSGNKEGFHLVYWETVHLTKCWGGLGMRDLRRRNNSLLMKWLWRFNGEQHALWKEVFISKYGQTGQCLTYRSLALIEHQYGELLGIYGPN